MSKGEATRGAILDRAFDLASTVGLEGLTIGRLAEESGLSKSGLFAHFKSKEQLQLDVLEEARQRFVDQVIRPALVSPRGEPRVRALAERWLAWGRASSERGGCLFVGAAFEMDDRPGPVRDRLVDLQRDWLESVSTMVRTGVTEKHFRAEVDCDQVAFELYGIMLAWTHAVRLMADPRADDRARAAFDGILVRIRR